ncbi:MAG: PEP-CTERM sorting domain-containing protein, partial [Planctomycetes bacterium]|nr:PEP-CTERM sorting domain-containing protein [Planctomycetota bacterium]
VYEDGGQLIQLTPIGGDANLDVSVDLSDLGILAGHYGTTGGMTWATGDFNGDGNVDLADLGILAGNYGENACSSSEPVPEPITLTLFGIGALALIRRRRQ